MNDNPNDEYDSPWKEAVALMLVSLSFQVKMA